MWLQVAEPGLVRDIISACQGISSATVAVGADGGGDLTFDVAKHLSRPQRQLILRLCEFGWLFRSVTSCQLCCHHTEDDLLSGAMFLVVEICCFRCEVPFGSECLNPQLMSPHMNAAL